MSNYKFDWNHVLARREDRNWLRPKKYGGLLLKFDRPAALLLGLTTEQGAAFDVLEQNVMMAEQSAVDDVLSVFQGYDKKWNDRDIRTMVMSFRQNMVKQKIESDSHVFVSADRAYVRMLGIVREQRRRFLPMGVRPGHVPGVRLRCGVFYRAPVTGRSLHVWSFEGLGEVYAASEFDLSGCAYVEAAHIGTGWWGRFVWAIPKAGVVAGVDAPAIAIDEDGRDDAE